MRNNASERRRALTLAARPQSIDIVPASTALIVVDMQNAYASRGGYIDLAGFDIDGIEQVISNIADLLPAARRAGIQVIFLQNGWDQEYREAGGTDSVNQKKSNAIRLMRERPELQGKLLVKGGWDYSLVDELKMGQGDIVVPKPRYSGFVSTALDSILRSRGIQHLLLCGVATNVCVETTLRDAFGLEYHPVLLRDACLQAGPSYVQEATIYNVETFFGWTASCADFFATAEQC